jgi:hypothetical protein
VGVYSQSVPKKRVTMHNRKLNFLHFLTSSSRVLFNGVAALLCITVGFAKVTHYIISSLTLALIPSDKFLTSRHGFIYKLHGRGTIIRTWLYTNDVAIYVTLSMKISKNFLPLFVGMVRSLIFAQTSERDSSCHHSLW